MNKEFPGHYYTLLEELQALDFVLVELTLYLDTHPNDGHAIQQYNQFAQKRMQVAHQYQLEFGPLMHFGHSYSKYPWQWVETPWPWQV
ncbi:spore coat protein CotJB [Paenibacillus filicis]|uniref:Spore coat protein CotJB n=1 Tax=Paenibacillus gyeongsangnamensis TaxID=3388067 RepID=A0ABT4Q9A3_9BACL|nr:spore coat protein CotJB [Paenibacillus filicis]MCZ8513447.1 spore coat protein CotJB [Paenibacillus filicis]